jgi:carboxypeptidase Q
MFKKRRGGLQPVASCYAHASTLSDPGAACATLTFMRILLLTGATFFLLLPTRATAQSGAASGSFTVSPETRDAARQLIGDSISNGKAYQYDEYLADMIGPRLTGSSNYMRAVEWAVQQFKELGLSNVHTEEWTIPATWEPDGPAVGHIIKPVEHQLHIYSMGWSPSTPSKGITAEVVYVSSFAPEAMDAQKAKLAGAIALVDPSSYGEKPTLEKILGGYAHLLTLSPAAIFTTGIANGAESLGALNFSGMISSVPVAQIGREDSSLIKRLLEHGPVTAQFSMTNSIRKEVKIPNVIAEISGSELASDVLIVGAHLDSWQPGTGAQDNGTGVASVLEAARAIKALNRAPRRTIRFILFGGEEEGLVGSNAYVRQHMAELPHIDAILITDSGSEPAKGWSLVGREDEKGAVAALKPLLAGLGAAGVDSDAQDLLLSDHAPFEVLGVPALFLWTEFAKYMSLHHKASDTFDSVVEKDLAQGAAVTTVTAYAIADSKEPFAAHLSPAEVQAMLQKAGKLEGYNYEKATGTLP